MSRRSIIIALAALLGVGLGINGLIMLTTPVGWYFAVPGVTTTGPYNQHFIRDIGLIFVLVSAGLIVGAARAEQRVVLWGAACLWLGGHALFHIWEVIVGICGSDALIRDFPVVTIPALLTLTLAIWAWRDGARQTR